MTLGTKPGTTPGTKPIIFISYSRADAAWKNRLDKHLQVLAGEGAYDTWVDSAEIETGDNWRQKIDEGLKSASAAIFMISTDFLTSKFIRQVEVEFLLKRRETENLRVFPVIVSPCNWKKIQWIEPLQVFNPQEGCELEGLGKYKAEALMAKLADQIDEWLNTGSTAAKREPAMWTAKEDGEKTVLLTRLPPKTQFFTGREDILTELDGMPAKQGRVVLVNGMGGMGKTEVCREWFHRHWDKFRYAGWIDYMGSIRQSFFAAVKVPGRPGEDDTVDQRYDAAVSFLADKKGEVVLVVDNVENPRDADLEDLRRFPFPVLVSSRHALPGFKARSLERMSMESCKELFYEYYRVEPEADTAGDVEEVIRWCGYHTLTVELLARTANNGGKRVKWLLEGLAGHGVALGPRKPPSVRTGWHGEPDKKIVMDHLCAVFDLSGVDEEEKQLLINLSLLPPMELAVDDLEEWLLPGSVDLTASLVEKGWLKRKEGTIFMHQVIQEVVRKKHPPDVKHCGELIVALAWKLKLEPTDNPVDKKELVVLAEPVVKHLWNENDQSLADLANNLSLRYQDLGQLEKALEFQKKTVQIFEEILDKNHPDLATSYNNLCTIYYALGQLEKALEFQKKATGIREEVLDKNHPSLATSYNNLSMIYKDLGQLEKALEFQKKTVQIVEEIPDKNHPSLATSYNNLSMIYKDLGQMEKALEFQKKATGIYEAALDKNHPLIATSYNNLSMIYKDLGQLEKALEFQKKDVEISEEILDKNHPDLATSYHNLSGIYRDLKKYRQALEYIRKAVAIKETLFPNGHPGLDNSRNRLGLIEKVCLEKGIEG